MRPDQVRDLKAIFELALKRGEIHATEGSDAIPTCNARYAKEMFGVLHANGKGLGQVGDGNATFEPDHWDTREEALEAFDAMFGTIERVETAATVEHRVKPGTYAVAGAGECGCGCGVATAGKSHFKPGHDARMVSQQVRWVVEGGCKGDEELEGIDIQEQIDRVTARIREAHSEALGKKFWNAAMAAWEKAK